MSYCDGKPVFFNSLTVEWLNAETNEAESITAYMKNPKEKTGVVPVMRGVRVDTVVKCPKWQSQRIAKAMLYNLNSGLSFYST